MKRVGYIYDKMADWDTIVTAEAVSTRRKLKNFGVRKHMQHRWRNLAEIQQMILGHKMKTGEYRHEQRVSGQDKLRDISKLHFHPSHIEHQLLVLASEERVDKALIRHTYASRHGFGQVKAALRIRDYLRRHRGKPLWYAQCDIVKYYDNIPHQLIRDKLTRMVKDKAFIDAFMEPFSAFRADGKGIPLGIRPSQQAGNIALMSLDRFATEELKCGGYTRYLDDFVFFGRTKGEVKWRTKRISRFLVNLGFDLHPPKIHRVSTGLDTLGYIYYGTRNDMFWRKSDKRRWLSRRHHVTNKRRMDELDSAAWGMLVHGNKHCKRLFTIKTGKITNRKNMPVNLRRSGIRRTERTDANGVPFIEAPQISMQVLLGEAVEVTDYLEGVRTSQGEDRWVLKVLYNGRWFKVYINSIRIKPILADMKRNNVTKFRTVFVDLGNKHYAMDEEQTEIMEINHKTVTEENGVIIYEETKEEIILQ